MNIQFFNYKILNFFVEKIQIFGMKGLVKQNPTDFYKSWYLFENRFIIGQSQTGVGFCVVPKQP